MRDSRGRRATLTDVAETAGVSVGTVSKVLNNRADVSLATRDRVLQVARDLDYAPSVYRPDGTHPVVDVVFDSLINPYSTQVLEGLVNAGREFGVDIVVKLIAPGSEDEGWARELRAKGRTGVIAVTSVLRSAHIKALGRASIPVVVVDPVNLARSDVVSIGATNWSGGLAAGQHLLDLGHRKVAFIGGQRGSNANQERFHGLRAALEAHGILIEAEFARFGRFTYESGRELALEMLAAANRPTAIFAGSDTIALGVIEAARALGLHVPNDLSVVGFDDTHLATWSAPQLSTIHQPLGEMGRVALRTLLELHRGQSVDSHHVQLSTSLVVRDSTASPVTATSETMK